MEDKNITAERENGAETAQKSRFLTWLENFFYHYKWHTIGAVLAIIAITVCTLQMCSKKDVDVHIIYAGSEEITKTSKNGDVSEYQTLLKSICEAARDYDGDGELVVDLETLFMLSTEQIKELGRELEESGLDDEYELTVGMVTENNRVFRDYMTYSNYYVCLLSDDLYEVYKTAGNVQNFTPLAPYVDEGTELTYYDECAAYLNSSAFHLLPGINKLPEDTVVCIRAKSAVASHFNSAETNEIYKRSEELLRSILNY